MACGPATTQDLPDPTQETTSPSEDTTEAPADQDASLPDTAADDADTASPPDDIVMAPCLDTPSGTDVGDCAPDFSLEDAEGTSHRLYDFAGDIIVLDFSTMWCPHCRGLADDLEGLHTELGDQGVTVITVLHQDNRSEPPDAADLQSWIDAYGITHLVLADPGERVEADFGGTYQPNGLVLDPTMHVTWRATGSAVAQGVYDAVTDLL
jgi:peroxiredoxin